MEKLWSKNGTTKLSNIEAGGLFVSLYQLVAAGPLGESVTTQSFLGGRHHSRSFEKDTAAGGMVHQSSTGEVGLSLRMSITPRQTYCLEPLLPFLFC